MGNRKARRVQHVHEQAQQRLETEAAEFAARQKRVEGAVREVWSAIEARDARAARREARIAKLRAVFEAGRAKAEEEYDAAAAMIRERYAGAVQQLRDNGRAPREIAELTGLTASEVRDALNGRPARTATHPAAAAEPVVRAARSSLDQAGAGGHARAVASASSATSAGSNTLGR